MITNHSIIVEAIVAATNVTSGNGFTLSNIDFNTNNSTNMTSPTNTLRSLNPISKSPNSTAKLRPNPIKVLKQHQEGITIERSTNTTNKNYGHNNNNNITNSTSAGTSASARISTWGLNSSALENFQPTKQPRITPTTATTPSVSIYGRDHFKQYVSTPNSVASYFDSPQTPAFKAISAFTSINNKNTNNNSGGTNEVVERRDKSPTTSSFPTTTDSNSFYTTTPTATGTDINNDAIEVTIPITLAPQDFLVDKKIETNSGSIGKDIARSYITTIKINPLSLNLTELENSQVILKTPDIGSSEENKIELVFDKKQKETIVIVTSDGTVHSPESIRIESIPFNTQQHSGATTTNLTFPPTSFSTSSPFGRIPSISSLLPPINGYTNTPQLTYAPQSPGLSDDEVDGSMFDKDNCIDDDEFMEDSVSYDNSMKKVARALTTTAIIINDSINADNNTHSDISGGSSSSSSNSNNNNSSNNNSNNKKEDIRVIEYNPGFSIDAPNNRASSDSTISIVERLRSNKEIYEQCIRAKKGVYRCNHCDAKFLTLFDFATHMDQVGLARPFMCRDSTCPWHVIGFSKRSEWSRHSKHQHGDEQTKFACGFPYCDKVFSRKDSMKRHHMLVHDNLLSRRNKKLQMLAEKQVKRAHKRKR